ncbi:uncharacterized protein LOC119679334 isoform X2 [Teleopsis dalmanni]|uniref:uncharacterized protein LOC119679334 isoform X2 n=1 Tax=Teleopsis dalmanni TaxID=139649 RepID=UPI0018CCE313|nr:uncharacterized protein LOC119679334 isoform X2 [Teleopsis dalmanni]
MIFFIRNIIFISFIGVIICSQAPQHLIRKSAQLSAPASVDASPVVSAVLLECPKEAKLKSSKRAPCEDQLMVNIRVNPSFHIEKMEKFLILDEVYDPKRHCKAKIMSPYLIEISRGEPVMMYPLEFSKSMKCEGCEAKPASLISEKPGPRSIHLNEDLSQLSPEQESFNRVIEKISSVFSPAVRRNMDESLESSQLRNDMSFNDPTARDQSIKKRTHTNMETNHRTQQDNKIDAVDKESIRPIKSGLGRFSSDIKATAKFKNDFLRNADDHESLANVGVDEKFVSKLEDGGKLAQLGLVKPSRDSQLTNVKLIGKNDFVNIVDNINSVEEGLQQQDMNSVTGFHEESDEFNNELNPLNYAEHNPIKQLKVMRGEGTNEFNNEFRPFSYAEHSPVKLKKYRHDDDSNEFSNELRSESSAQHNPVKRKKGRRDEDSDEVNNGLSPINNIEHNSIKRIKGAHTDYPEEFNRDSHPASYAPHNTVKRKKVTRAKKRHKVKHRLKPENKIENSESVENEDYKDESYDEGNQMERKLKIPVNFKNCECKTKIGVKSQDYDADDQIGENVEHNYEDIQTNHKDQNMREANNENKDKTQNFNPKNKITDKNHDNMYEESDLDSEYAYNDFDERGSVPDAENHLISLNKRQETQQISDDKLNVPEEGKVLMQRNADNVLTPLDFYENSLGKLTSYRATDIISEPTSDDLKINDYDMLNGDTLQGFNGKAANVGQKKNFGYVEVKALNFVPSAEKTYPRNSKYNLNSKYVSEKKLSNKQDVREHLRGNIPVRGSYTELTFSHKPGLKSSTTYHLPSTFYNEKYDMPNTNRDYVYNNRDQSYLSKGMGLDAFKFMDSYDNNDRKGFSKLKPIKGSGFYDDDFYMNKDLMDFTNSKNVDNNEPQMTAVKEDPEYKPDYGAILSYGVTVPKFLEKEKEKPTGMGSKSLWTDSNLPSWEPQVMRDIDESGEGSKLKSQETAEYKGSWQDSPYEYSMNKADNIKYSYPKRPPISRIITDPHLSFTDKMRIIDTISPQNTNEDRKMNQFSREFDYTVPHMATPYPIPIPDSWKIRREHPKNMEKRSYLMYDDLGIHDTLKDNDYNFDEMDQKGLHLGMQRHTDEDVQPCNSCGGKGKKPPTKTDSTTSLGEQDCGCQKDPSVCSCADKTLKGPRSVSDTWYSVFNMSAPLPFLTTSLKIFRKRRNIWWKIAPSITLNSLSGIFANANLSILFSSHVDIFQLEKSLKLKNHQLLIPKDNKPSRRSIISNLAKINRNPNIILAIDKKRRGSRHAIKNKKANPVVDDQILCRKIRRKMHADSINQLNASKNVRNTETSNDCVNKSKNLSSKDDIQTIGDLGVFPVTMNVLERCPHDKNHLCLNMLDDKVPAFNFKVKMPFRNNEVIRDNSYKVKIAKITSDATTKDALQVSVDVINEGLRTHEFSIGVMNCDLGACSSSVKSTVNKHLYPRIGETISFLLPLISEPNQKHKKFNCDVVVTPCNARTKMDSVKRRRKIIPNQHATKYKPIAIRQVQIEPDARCFCVWDCRCHCVPNIETHVDYHVCQRMDHEEKLSAGLLLHVDPDDNEENVSLGDKVRTSKTEGGFNAEEEESSVWIYVRNAIILILLMILLGLLKASLGVCVKPIDKCGYDWIQPAKGYEDSSRCRRFVINTFFFILFPFLCWCRCFSPTKDELLCANSDWKVEEDDMLNQMDSECRETYHSDNDSKNYKRRHRGTSNERLTGGDESNLTPSYLKELKKAINEESMFDDEDDTEENSRYILNAMKESRAYLQKILSCHPSPDPAPKIICKEADELVKSLIDAQKVYRTLNEPIGNVQNIPVGYTYCVQGLFLYGEMYEFLAYSPIIQYRGYSADGSKIESLPRPVNLSTRAFTCTYVDEMDIFKKADLSVKPPPDVPCINMSTIANVASSVASLASKDSFQSKIESLSKILENTKEVRNLTKRNDENCFSFKRNPSFSTSDTDFNNSDYTNSETSDESNRSDESDRFDRSDRSDRSDGSDKSDGSNTSDSSDRLDFDTSRFRCDTIYE